MSLASVRGPQLSQWIAELNYPIDKDSHLVFDLVKEFLQNAGQGQMIIQVRALSYLEFVLVFRTLDDCKIPSDGKHYMRLTAYMCVR